jgi:PIN domain nuclease of toxin-antitoxin system
MMPQRSLLLDTHVVIWMAKKPERLPAMLRSAIETAEERLVSCATAWEIQIKFAKYGEGFGFSLDDLEQAMKTFSCTELPIEYRDIRRLDQMRFLHADPFDRLLMSQAAERSTYLATLDQDIIRTFEVENSFSIFTDQAREK